MKLRWSIVIVTTRSISCFIQPATLNYFCFEITEDNFNRPWVKKHKSCEISIGKQFAIFLKRDLLSKNKLYRHCFSQEAFLCLNLAYGLVNFKLYAKIKTKAT